MSKKVDRREVKKAIVYIDGYNLYYGMRQAHGGKYKWLDLQKLAESFLKPGMQLEGVKYFTAITKSTEDCRQRQEIYLKALRSYCEKIEIIYGRFLSKTKTCRNCGNQYPFFEEKKTDVNIACHMLSDAHQNRFDCCYVVSGDSDLVPPVEIIRQFHPDKHTIVAHPPRRKSSELCDVAHGWFAISEQKLKRNQLPDEVITQHGGRICRPEEWHKAK